MDEIKQKNQEKFLHLRKFNLPLGQYAIISSGALGTRNLRIMGDIDLIVTPELWNILAEEYGMTVEKGIKKIIFPGGIIEAFREGSFNDAPGNGAPTIANRIAQAEIIDGLPFDSLKNVLYFKRKLARDKDLQDILLIDQWLEAQRTTAIE